MMWAMETQPSFPDVPAHEAADRLGAAFSLGVQCMQAGDQDGAIAAFRAALALAPGLVAAHLNLGLLLERGHPGQAEAHLRAAVAADPFSALASQHLGAMLAGQKRFEEAEQIYRAALALAPEVPALLSNLGVLLACTGREAQAMACYRAALAAAPDFNSAHFNIAYLLLRNGDYAAGWRELEHRSWYARLAAHFAFPRWQGEPLQGKRLLIGVEAGHGDMIQFCRYAPLAKQAGAAHVGIVCHSGLKRLFTGLEGIDAVFGVEDALPATGWDYWVPPLSMPGLFGTRLDHLPASLPYLHAVSASAAVRECMAALDGSADGQRDAVTTRSPAMRPLRVGLAWQGNPLFENDGERSLASLAILAPLAEIDGVEWFSLQKGAGELGRIDPLPAGGPTPCAYRFPGTATACITDLAPCIADFADTAALIGTLDLVIAVDTAVAHLSGAMGRPCWVLLPAFKPDWRWLKEREDSPWYPGVMRLFRQQEAGSWTDVVASLKLALRAKVAELRGRALN
jgi:Tfp pilus assembly protein PilF